MLRLGLKKTVADPKPHVGLFESRRSPDAKGDVPRADVDLEAQCARMTGTGPAGRGPIKQPSPLTLRYFEHRSRHL